MQQSCHFGLVLFAREYLLVVQYLVDGSSLRSSMLHEPASLLLLVIHSVYTECHQCHDAGLMLLVAQMEDSLDCEICCCIFHQMLVKEKKLILLRC